MKISKEIGNEAEKKAVEYLKSLGYSILETNFHSRFGEIDIIAKKENNLHFIEVKYSKKSDPFERITPTKLTKIIKTIEFYMYRTNINFDYQIDAILICDESLKMVENISF